jgi:hypothetical protein
MQDKLRGILNESRLTPSNHNLEHLLFVRLQKRIKRNEQINFITYSMASFVSAMLLFISVKYLYSDLYDSPVFGYAQLIFSEDLNTIAYFSREIIYALAESLPVASMTISLGLLFAFMVSINKTLISLYERKNKIFIQQ